MRHGASFCIASGPNLGCIRTMVMTLRQLPGRSSHGIAIADMEDLGKHTLPHELLSFPALACPNTTCWDAQVRPCMHVHQTAGVPLTAVTLTVSHDSNLTQLLHRQLSMPCHGGNGLKHGGLLSTLVHLIALCQMSWDNSSLSSVCENTSASRVLHTHSWSMLCCSLVLACR